MFKIVVSHYRLSQAYAIQKMDKLKLHHLDRAKEVLKTRVTNLSSIKDPNEDQKSELNELIGVLKDLEEEKEVRDWIKMLFGSFWFF